MIQEAKHGDRGAHVEEIYQFLARYGYIGTDLLLDFYGKVDIEKLPAPRSQELFDAELEKAVKLFQIAFKIEPDGIVAGTTLEVMRTPRCGVPDRPTGEFGIFSAPVCAWRSRTLRYHFFSYVPQIGQEVHRQIFLEALDQWVVAAKLTVSEGPAHVELQSFTFVSAHRDHPLGYAYLPCQGRTSGDISFNTNVRWSLDPKPHTLTLDFYSNVLHELGHALGLDHSSDRTAVMFPSLIYGERKRQLTADDLAGIRKLYP
jgi:Matrixin/Putative peptidoglycan binding domain